MSNVSFFRNLAVMILIIKISIINGEEKTCFYSSYDEEIVRCKGLIKSDDKVHINLDGLDQPCDNDLNCLQSFKGKGLRITISDKIIDKNIVLDDLCETPKRYNQLNDGYYFMIGNHHYNANPQGIYQYTQDWENIIQKQTITDLASNIIMKYRIFNYKTNCCYIQLNNREYYFKTEFSSPKWTIFFYREKTCFSKNGIHQIDRIINDDDVIKEYNDGNNEYKLLNVYTSSLEKKEENGLTIADDKFSYGVFIFKIRSIKNDVTQSDPNGKGTVYVILYDYTEEKRNKRNCDKFYQYEKAVDFGNEKWSFINGDCPEPIIRFRLSPMKIIFNENDHCIHFNNLCLIYIDNGNTIVLKDKSKENVISNGIVTNKSKNKNLFIGYSTISDRHTVGNKLAFLAIKILDFSPYQNSKDFNDWVNVFNLIN